MWNNKPKAQPSYNERLQENMSVFNQTKDSLQSLQIEIGEDIAALEETLEKLKQSHSDVTEALNRVKKITG